jgi:hypothetical protein
VPDVQKQHGQAEQTMGTANLFSSHQVAEHAQETRVSVARPSSIFSAAIACLGVAYALSWLEFALAVMVGTAGTGSTATPIAAMVASRILIGGLYLCVALRLQWARWLTVVLGLASVILVGPMLGTEWSALPVAAAITGATLVCKLAASLFLVSLALSSRKY